MAVTYDGGATDGATTSGDTSFVVTAPAGSGGILLAFANCVSSRTLSPPAGWSTDVTFAATSMNVYLFTRADDAASNYTFTASGNFNQGMASVVRLGGATLTGMQTSTSTRTGSHPDFTETDITTASANMMLLWYGETTLNGGSCTVSGSQTERIDNGSFANGSTVALYTEIRAAAGSGTPPTLTFSGYGSVGGIGVAIAQSSVAATGGSSYQVALPRVGGVPMAGGRFLAKSSWGSPGGSGVGYGNRRRRVIC